MDNGIVIGLNYYFGLLKDINKKLLKVVGMETVNSYVDNTNEYFEITEKLARLIPYTVVSKTQEVRLVAEDGIATFEDTFNYLRKSLEKILVNHKDILIILKTIRNKHEHVAHYISFYGSSSGSNCMTDITYKYNNPKEKQQIIGINCQEIISLLIDLNNLFDVIMEDVLDYINTLDDNGFKWYYKDAFFRLKFSNFNKIFNSKILLEVSRAIQ